MIQRLTCRACGEHLNQDESEYCDPCLQDMESADDEDE